MSELRFRLTPEAIPTALLEKAYFAGWGRVPKPTKIALDDNELVIQNPTRGSGTLHVPWPHERFGVVMESTDSLTSRPSSYLLIKELGRGAFGRLFRRLFEWQTVGFKCPDELRTQITQASRRFSKAAVSDENEPDLQQEFVLLLKEVDHLSFEMTHQFTDQSIHWRVRHEDKLSVHLGIGLNTHPIESLYEFELYAKYLKKAFHAVAPLPTWREMEPAPNEFAWELLDRRISIPARFGFRPILGPLINFDPTTLPAWLLPKMNEEGYFESRATRLVNALAERFGSVADSWILTSHINSMWMNYVPISRALHLTRLLAQQMRSRGIESPILVGIDRPWGEYAQYCTADIDQTQIADFLIGCHDIDAFLLEISIGLDERSTYPRDPMAVSTMIDHWSFLGKKVYIALSVPSAVGNDPLDRDKSLPPEMQWSEQLQLTWTETMLRTLLGKRMVQGIFWTHLQDGDENLEETRSPEPFTSLYSGLIDSSRVLKHAFNKIVDIRREHLK